MKYEEMIGKLQKRYGTDSQMNLFRAQLRARKRKTGEALQSLYLDVSRLAALAFPGVPTEHAEAVAVDAFIDALGDEALETRVRDREPKDLDSAYRVTLVMEANSRTRISEGTENDHRREYNRVRTVTRKEQDVQNNLVTSEEPEEREYDSTRIYRLERMFKQLCGERKENMIFGSRLDRLEAMMLQFMEEMNQKTTTNPQTRRELYAVQSGEVLRNKYSAVSCFKCGVTGHYARVCPERQVPESRSTEESRRWDNGRLGADGVVVCYGCKQPGHMVRECPRKETISMNSSVRQARSVFKRRFVAPCNIRCIECDQKEPRQARGIQKSVRRGADENKVRIMNYQEVRKEDVSFAKEGVERMFKEARVEEAEGMDLIQKYRTVVQKKGMNPNRKKRGDIEGAGQVDGGVSGVEENWRINRQPVDEVQQRGSHLPVQFTGHWKARRQGKKCGSLVDFGSQGRVVPRSGMVVRPPLNLLARSVQAVSNGVIGCGDVCGQPPPYLHSQGQVCSTVRGNYRCFPRTDSVYGWRVVMQVPKYVERLL
jgi:hypothetical protein